MNIQQILECGANVSFTISALDLKEFIVSLIEEHSQNSVSIPTEKYLTTEETAQRLGCDISTLWRWDKSGYLKKIKLGNKVRYRESDVLKLMVG